MWKYLQIIIKRKISKEEEGSSNPKEIKELISPIKEIKEPISSKKNNYTNNRTNKYGK